MKRTVSTLLVGLAIVGAAAIQTEVHQRLQPKHYPANRPPISLGSDMVRHARIYSADRAK